VGKKLRALLTEAGFSRTAGSVAGGADGTDEVTRHVGAWQAEYFTAPALVEYVVACGVATPEELTAISEAWRRWSEAPGAFWARFWCQAVGWV